MSAIQGKRVLIVKTSSLGDIILGLQVANTLKANDPTMSICWVSRRRFQPIVEASNLVDRVFTFYRTGNLRDFWGLCKELHRERFDYVLDMQGLARSGLMSFAAKSPIKVGRSDAREGATLFYDRMVPMPPKQSKPHAIEILLEFCRVFGFEPSLAGMLKFADSVDLDAAVRSESGDGRAVVIFPGKERSNWDWSGYLELAEGLLGRDDRIKVIMAGLQKGTFSESLSKKWPERFVDLRGETDLGQVGALIQSSDLVVSNEVAPIQLGVSVGTPTLGVYGPVDPDKYGPYPIGSDGHSIVRAPGGRLSELSTEVVLEAAMKALEKSWS